MKTVILAGGRGTRLAPYTSILPKPLMPVGDRAILEILIEQLAAQDLRDVTLCVGYLSHLIEAVLNHSDAGVEITYVHEGDPLGTAAPLRLVDGLDDTFLVMNGDVLTTLDYRELVRHHHESGNTVTIAAHRRRTRLDYGVIHLGEPGGDPQRVTAYEEKPETAAMVSMGVYVLEPGALEHIPADAFFDFPDLVHALLAARQPVGAYVYDGFWLDLGRKEDYEAAAAALDSEGQVPAHGDLPA